MEYSTKLYSTDLVMSITNKTDHFQRRYKQQYAVPFKICDNQWKGEPFWLASLMPEETKQRVSPSNLSGNRSVNIAPVSSLLGRQCGSKAVCRMDGSCLAARVNTLPFCYIPRIHYTASQHTGEAVRSYQFHYPLNPLTGALTC